MPTLTDIAGTVISSGTPCGRVALLAGAMLLAGCSTTGKHWWSPGTWGSSRRVRGGAGPSLQALGPVDEIEDTANRLYDSDVKRDQIIWQAFKE